MNLTLFLCVLGMVIGAAKTFTRQVWSPILMYNSSKDLVSIPKQADGVGSFSQIEQDILYPENTLAILNGDSKNVISVSPKGEVTYIFTDTPSPKHRGKKLAVLDFKIADISYFMQSLSTDGKRALLYVAVASSHCIIVVDRYYQTASVLSTACKQYSVTGPSTNQLKHYEFVWPQALLAGDTVGTEVTSFYVSSPNQYKISTVDLITGLVSERACCDTPSHKSENLMYKPLYMTKSSTGSILVTSEGALLEFDPDTGLTELLTNDGLYSGHGYGFVDGDFQIATVGDLSPLTRVPGFSDVYLVVDRTYNIMRILDLDAKMILSTCRAQDIENLKVRQPRGAQLYPSASYWVADCNFHRPQAVIFPNSESSAVLVSQPHGIIHRKLGRWRESLQEVEQVAHEQVAHKLVRNKPKPKRPQNEGARAGNCLDIYSSTDKDKAAAMIHQLEVDNSLYAISGTRLQHRVCFAEESNYNMTLKCRTELKEHGKLRCFHMDVNTEQGNNCLHITYSCSMFLTLESDNSDHHFTKLSSLKNIHCRVNIAAVLLLLALPAGAITVLIIALVFFQGSKKSLGRYSTKRVTSHEA